MRRKMLKCVVILQFLSLIYSVTSTDPRKEGQYKITVLIVRKCSTKEVINPHRYFGTFFEWHAGVFNSTGKTYIKGNYTVLKPVQNAKVRARNFIWEDNRWKLRIRIPGFGCYRQIFRLFIQALNVDVDISKCAVKPSPSVAVKKFDFNTVMHAWELEKEYGLWMWIFEITSSSKTLECFVVESLITPKENLS